MTNGKFPGRKPVGSLPPVAEERDIGFGVKPAQKLRSQTVAMIKNQHRCRQSGTARVLTEKLSSPFGLKQIPIGLDLLRAGELGIDRKSRAHDGAFEHEDIFIFRIGIPMPPTVPPARI